MTGIFLLTTKFKPTGSTRHKVKTKFDRFLFQTSHHEDMHSYLASRWIWVIRFTLRSPYLERRSPAIRWMGSLLGPRAGL